MYKAINYTTNELLVCDDLPTLYRAARRAQRWAYGWGDEVPGFYIYGPTGIGITVLKSGSDLTVEEAEPSIRVYHILYRMNKANPSGLTLRQVRDLILENKSNKIIFLGGQKTLDELFELLYDNLGYDSDLWELRQDWEYLRKNRKRG